MSDLDHEHDYVMLTPPNASYFFGPIEPVPIDKAIAPLMEALWSLHFSTHFCCEGDDQGRPLGLGDAHIMFGSYDEACLFAGIADAAGVPEGMVIARSDRNLNDPSACTVHFRHADIPAITDAAKRVVARKLAGAAS